MADPAAAELRAKVLAIIRSGRLEATDSVVLADGRCVKFDAVIRPPKVSTQAFHPPRYVTWRPAEGWLCDCGDPPGCRHVVAAKLIAPTTAAADPVVDPVAALGLPLSGVA